MRTCPVGSTRVVLALLTFGRQAVYQVLPAVDTGQGHFYAGRIVVYDHDGTHLDAPGTTATTRRPSNSRNPIGAPRPS